MRPSPNTNVTLVTEPRTQESVQSPSAMPGHHRVAHVGDLPAVGDQVARADHELERVRIDHRVAVRHAPDQPREHRRPGQHRVARHRVDPLRAAFVLGAVPSPSTSSGRRSGSARRTIRLLQASLAGRRAEPAGGPDVRAARIGGGAGGDRHPVHQTLRPRRGRGRTRRAGGRAARARARRPSCPRVSAVRSTSFMMRVSMPASSRLRASTRSFSVFSSPSSSWKRRTSATSVRRVSSAVSPSTPASRADSAESASAGGAARSAALRTAGEPQRTTTTSSDRHQRAPRRRCAPAGSRSPRPHRPP